MCPVSRLSILQHATAKHHRKPGFVNLQTACWTIAESGEASDEFGDFSFWPRQLLFSSFVSTGRKGGLSEPYGLCASQKKDAISSMCTAISSFNLETYLDVD